MAIDLTGPDFSQTRYWTEFDERGERLVMPLRRKWKVVGLALAGFAFGSIQHIMHISNPPELADLLWGALLLGGLLHLVLNMATSMLAREILRIENGTLVHGWRLGFLHREKRYPLREIHALSAEREIAPAKDDQLLSPLRDFGKTGAVNFDWGDKTIGIGAALDQDHGRQVVEWIVRRAPRSVVEG